MNYRHAFHAGNHTEVFKHSALAMILGHLLQKPQPFMVLDTHGGIGLYDLTSDEASRTGERVAGVDKVFPLNIPSAHAYINILKSLNGPTLEAYPGSPEIVRQMLRSQDRLVACELHPDDVQILEHRYRKDSRVVIQHRNGYDAVKALLPPRERRGMVFIDPPYEDRSETDKMGDAIKIGLRKWATGIFCLWYPVKDFKIRDALVASAKLTGCPSTLCAEFLPFAVDGTSLSGSGLIICNTPWKLDDKLRGLCQDLVPVLGDDRSKWSVEWVTEPR